MIPLLTMRGRGSSPRMRGTLVSWTFIVSSLGIIPAYAGNTTRLPWRLRAFRDHPRVCGEHVVCMMTTEPSQGSSPRMRGTPRRDGKMRHAGRIIPAYAGNTGEDYWQAYRGGDHPRVCGEHVTSPLVAVTLPGSSPRMRGTLAWAISISPLTGIIPAYAGNTHYAPVACGRDRDHPRVCGEHRGAMSWLSGAPGSSPRMRGTPYGKRSAPRGRGIIPAYAGNTTACFF